MMNLLDITKAIARNLDMVADDNSTIISKGRLTEAGIKDEINRVYLEEVIPTLLNAKADDFTVETRVNTYRAVFVVSSIDTVNYLINSTTGIFGNADEGAKLQNPTTGEFYTIDTVITSQQVKVKELPANSLVGANVYLLTNVVQINDIENLKEVTKFEIKYNSTDQTFQTCKKEALTNFKDRVKEVYTYPYSDYYYTQGSLRIDNVEYRSLFYYPYPTSYLGEIKFSYTKLPPKLLNDTDMPAIDVIGLGNAIIYGVSMWGSRILGNTDDYLSYKGDYEATMSKILTEYKPNRSQAITYKFLAR
jgi:hypothetical protein